jgi:hypothetical protein
MEVSGWARKWRILSFLKVDAAGQNWAGSVKMPVFIADAGLADPCDFLTNCVQQSNLRC